MSWSKPDFVEINLSMEVTGYVNTDESLVGVGSPDAQATDVGPQATDVVPQVAGHGPQSTVH